MSFLQKQINEKALNGSEEENENHSEEIVNVVAYLSISCWSLLSESLHIDMSICPFHYSGSKVRFQCQ